MPSLTETLFTFGAADIVMGVTDFCVEPPEAMKSKVRVGGTKTLDIEKVKEMKPDLVIANAEENREEDIRQLVRSGIKVFVTFPRTVSAAIKMMRQIAEMTETLDRAEPILQEADETLAEVTALSQTKPRPRVFCPIWRRPWMSVGADTYTHDFIAVCGGRNLFADRHDRYPRIELDEVARRIPDVILLPNEPYNFREEHKADFTDRTHVPAVRDDRIHIVDGKILCWYGPRIAKGLRFINGLLQNPASKNKASGKTSKAST
ncbi:MAG: cobalamin-binding protein [Chloroflexi bacterium]|nr:cobalamin-binding protein [Chloroflexota bacterium]